MCFTDSIEFSREKIAQENFSSTISLFFVQEAFDLIGKLREEIIQQVKLRDKLNNDLEQQREEHRIDLKEREQIEQMLNKELNAIKDENRKENSE